MLETKTRLLQNPNTSVSASLIAFKPRQVLLAQQSKAGPVMAKKQTTTLEPQQKSLLLHSILHYLQINGFDKTFKRFLKEAQIEGDSWKSSTINLEDIYCKYLNTCTDNDTSSKGQKEPEPVDGTNGKNVSSNPGGSDETISKKKKKKRSVDKDSNVPDASNPESVDKSTKDVVNGQEVIAEDKADVSVKKQKDKKKKKSEENSEGAVCISNDNNDLAEETNKKDKKKKAKGENGATDLKDSKKRKRLASDETASQADDGVGTEESKRRKTEDLEESKDVAEQGKSDGDCAGNGNSNGNHQNELNNSAKTKSSRKEQNGSAEPKTVNAFQRVKVEKVEFVDDRLRDNSYWAKDGADVGYGAKAQEILGQVKGRDFRHEKTKKKRGSYRGGLIDLDSHSVKFNYSDEE